MLNGPRNYVRRSGRDSSAGFNPVEMSARLEEPTRGAYVRRLRH
jgi:hypothetical protein